MVSKASSFLFSVTILLLLGGISYYFSQHPDDPFGDLMALGKYAPDTQTLFEADRTKKVYRWQDVHGKWHYGDTPPEAQTEMINTQQGFQDEMNSIRSSEETTRQTAQVIPLPAARTNQTPNANTTSTPSAPLIPGPETMMTIINNVRNLDERLAEREKIIEEASRISNTQTIE